jgi:DNA-binding transcriptional MocR family regulator
VGDTPRLGRHAGDARRRGRTSGRIRPGTAFYPDGRGGNQMRLAFCYPPPERIREGVARLGTLLGDEQATYRSLRP